MNKLFEITRAVSNISSSNKKKEQLLIYKNNVVYIEAFLLLRDILSPNITSGIGSKTIGDLVQISHNQSPISDQELRDLLRNGVENRNELCNISCPSELFKGFLKDVFDGTLRMGLGIKTINEVLTSEPNPMEPIHKPKYMRCCTTEETSLDSLTYPVFVQLKEDSEFSNLNITLNHETGFYNVTSESRNGKPQPQQSRFIKELQDFLNNHTCPKEIKVLLGEGVQLHGELKLFNQSYNRETQRGLISSFMTSNSKRENILTRKVKSQAAKQKLYNELQEMEREWSNTSKNIGLSAWDIIPIQSAKIGIDKTSYEVRFNKLKKLLELMDIRNIILTPTTLCESEEKVDEVFQEYLNQGEEGAVVKTMSMIWKDGTSSEQIKLKEFHDFEMKVVGWNEGAGKFKDGIGSLIVESSCGRLQTSATGLSLKEKGLVRVDESSSAKGYKKIEGFQPDDYIGQIVTIKANAVSKGKNSETYSLTFPSIVKFRHDKNEADELEYIQGLFKRSAETVEKEAPKGFL